MNHAHWALFLAHAAQRTLGYWWLGIAVVAGVVAMPANAQTLPNASTFVQCSADGNNSFHGTECTQGGFPGVPASAFATAGLTPLPFVSVEVASPSTAVLGAGADANSTYYFQVTGGNPGDVVPVMFDFALGASSSSESSALARIIIRTSEVPFTVEELVCNPQECVQTTFSDTLMIPVRSGAMLDSVTLYALAQAPATRFSSETARAFADPYIFIDPTFPNASLYSIAVSPGVGNTPRVPEPATFWLLLVPASILIARRSCRSGAAIAAPTVARQSIHQCPNC